MDLRWRLAVKILANFGQQCKSLARPTAYSSIAAFA